MQLTEDIELKLLHGLPLYVDDIEIKPFTLSEITKLGLSNYWQYISLLVADIPKTEEYKEYEDITMFEVYLHLPDKTYFIDALKTILRAEKVRTIEGESVVFIDNKVIDRDKYENIKQIIIWQNCIDLNKKNEFNPMNDEARRLIELMEEQERIVRNKKGNKGNISFSTQINALATKSNDLNIFKVFDLTMYQFSKIFNRTIMIDNYQTQIMATIQGAKIDDMKHWTENEN